MKLRCKFSCENQECDHRKDVMSNIDFYNLSSLHPQVYPNTVTTCHRLSEALASKPLAWPTTPAKCIL